MHYTPPPPNKAFSRAPFLPNWGVLFAQVRLGFCALKGAGQGREKRGKPTTPLFKKKKKKKTNLRLYSARGDSLFVPPKLRENEIEEGGSR